MDPVPVYRERLSVPVRWWLLAALLVGSLWVAYAVATPPLVAGLVAAAAALIAAGLLYGYGNARLEVGPAGIRAGRAVLPLDACGDVVALDSEQFVRARGVDADVRAYLLLRPYLDRAVRIDVRDDGDPTPYWLLATRHPERMAAAVAAVVEAVRHAAE